MKPALPKELEFDWEAASEDIITSIRYHFKNTRAERGVIGLSGGVDSSVAATLAVKALGKENVMALILPDRGVTPEPDIQDALKVASMLGVKHRVLEINPVVDAVVQLMPELIQTTMAEAPTDQIAFGNVKARARMVLLYAYANILGDAQVIGTGDKSELLLGYTTKYGDHGVDLLPIGDLYKSQVRYMAWKLGLPDTVWMKPPSPRLLKDQTAESDLGLDYHTVDRILYYRVEQRYPEERIAMELGIELPRVVKICDMIRTSHHKRKSPPICKLGDATINWDWRMPME